MRFGGFRAGLLLRRIMAPPVVFCAAFGALLGAGVFTFTEAEGLSYLGDDAATCANCHIMRGHLDGWRKSSHQPFASCNDCHVPHALVAKYLVKGENGFSHSKAFTLQDFHEPIQIRPVSAAVVQQNCLRCHGPLVAMSGTAKAGDESFACARCHSGVGHGPSR